MKLRFLLRRLLLAILLVVVVSSASLVLVQLAPGDFVTEKSGVSGRSEVTATERRRLGLDRPAAAQFVDWFRHAARFDFGRSFAYDRTVTELVPERAWNTAILASAALLLATVVGLSLGTLTGSRSGGWPSRLIRHASLLILSMPPLLTSLLMVFIAARTQWLPIGGMRSSAAAGVTDIAQHLVVPVLALALPLAAMFERLQSQAMRDTIAQPFVLASRARGVSDARIVWRGALKASLRPIASVYGMAAASLFGGSFVVEMITAWPGLGRLMLDALRARDLYLVAGCAAAGSLFVAVGSLMSDVALVFVDPRAGE